jgi:hypothetical protein
MRKNPLAAAFVVLVWTTLLLILANRAYNDMINSGSFDFNLKGTGDLINGNP